MGTKHTPGNWRIDGRPFSQHGMHHISSGDYIIAHALGQTATSEIESAANARLIVAAPKLLEALELLQGFDFRLDDSEHGKEIRRRAVAAIDAASPRT